ncbi:MAG TPA: SDR family NAD(P)-dependent oxidoreductase [Acidimicrobiales bacterium]|jgi:NAD(P)-dependent dehydrogenase (short-subunit alcohol dehydrogenase family)
MAALLEGRTALVTGAGHGIGQAHVLELARQGASVVVNDLGSSVSGEGSGRDADRVVDAITAAGGTAIADYGDVGDETGAEAMVAAAIDAWGRLDILVNNAGIVRDRAIWNMEADDFDAVMRVHVRGSWLTSRAAARHWRQRAKSGEAVAGRIINTTSGAGLQGNFGQSNYATAKAALTGLTMTLSVELAGIGCTANLIGPGALTRLSATTGLPDPVEPLDLASDDWSQFDPRMSAPVVAWLASQGSAGVSGQCFRVMGEHLHWMQGWREHVTISNGGRHWDATTLGRALETDVFGTRASGLRLGG